MDRKSRTVTVRLSEREYKALHRQSKALGARNVSDYTRTLLFGRRDECMSAPTEAALTRMDAEIQKLSDSVQELRAFVSFKESESGS